MQKRKPKFRLNIEMSEETSNKLEFLADELETSRVGAIRDALAILDIIVEQRKKGRKIGFAKSAKAFDEQLTGFPRVA